MTVQRCTLDRLLLGRLVRRPQEALEEAFWHREWFRPKVRCIIFKDFDTSRLTGVNYPSHYSLWKAYGWTYKRQDRCAYFCYLWWYRFIIGKSVDTARLRGVGWSGHMGQWMLLSRTGEWKVLGRIKFYPTKLEAKQQNKTMKVTHWNQIRDHRLHSWIHGARPLYNTACTRVQCVLQWRTSLCNGYTLNNFATYWIGPR